MSKTKIILVCISTFCLVLLVLIVILIPSYPIKYKSEVIKYAHNYNLDPELVMALMYAESGFDSNAVSKKGAIGLMQIMPLTAKWIASELNDKGFDLFEVDTNVRYGCFYLNYLYGKFSDKILVLCAYNAGESRVREWLDKMEINKDNIPFTETKNYVNRVLKLEKYYSKKL